jgi:molybdopterin-guanine dinucleotide biosynthesis protein A
MSDQTIAGAILAGGQARRFGGRDKSRLTGPDGRSIIVRQLDLLQRVTGTTFIVTTPEDRQGRPDRFSDLDAAVAVDQITGAGALGGIHAALAHAATALPAVTRVIVLACDLPFITESLLTDLAARAEQSDGAWVCGARGPEPLIACYRIDTLDRMTRAIEAGERRATALGTLLTLSEVHGEALAAHGDPDRLTANVNTPEEWRRVQ